MKHTFILLSGLLLTVIFALLSCEPKAPESFDPASVAIDSVYMESVLQTLASDEFEGRGPFSAGEAKTVAYLKSEMEKLGLAPGNGDSYFQEVPMVKIVGQADEKMTVSGNGKTIEMTEGEDFVAQSPREEEQVNIEDAELVFCGFGVVAPEYGWNDYEGIDMKGKVAVVLVNDPGYGTNDSAFFKGNTMTYYGRWVYKFEEAARQGAAGVLVVHETKAAGYPWFVVKRSGSGARLYLQTEDKNASRCAMQGWISQTATFGLLEAAGLGDEDLIAKARNKGFKPVPLGLNASVGIQNELEYNKSQNVAGLVKGSKTPDEYVIYCAHWDHLGIASPVEGDSIYNGAMDNATGSATAMAIAKAYAEQKPGPDRSVLFLFVTAEEQGLLGSEYYATNPIFPIKKTAAAINMDGGNINGPMKDLTVTGFGQSEMEDMAKAVAEAQGRYMQPEQEPEKGYYFRSDHFNFAKVGVPALYCKGGYDHKTGGKEYAMKLKDNFTYNHYHRPSDEYRPDEFRYEGLVQDASLFFQVGWNVANGTTWPQWYDGSEFKAKR